MHGCPPPPRLISCLWFLCLKVLANEKRGGLTVVSFDRSPFKLYSLWFSYKSMQAPSCERPKTNQRTLFLSFAINNCYPTSDEKLLAAFELILRFGGRMPPLFVYFSYFDDVHTIIQSHSYNTFIRHHLLKPLSISSSLVRSVGMTSLWCRAENRTRACLTASRRVANWATPHHKLSHAAP